MFKSFHSPPPSTRLTIVRLTRAIQRFWTETLISVIQAKMEYIFTETQRDKVRHRKLVLLLNIRFYWVRSRDTNLKVASFAGFMGYLYLLNESFSLIVCIKSNNKVKMGKTQLLCVQRFLLSPSIHSSNYCPSNWSNPEILDRNNYILYSSQNGICIY